MVPGVSDQPTFRVDLSENLVDPEVSGYAGVGQPMLPIIRFSNQGLGVGEIARWSGIGELTLYPGAEDDNAVESWRHQWPSPTRAPRLEGLSDCDSDCDAHSEAVHDALRLLKARHMIPFRFLGPSWDPRNLDDFMAWLRAITWTTKDSQGEGHGNLHQLNSQGGDLAHLPIPATRLNAELIRICKCSSVAVP